LSAAYRHLLDTGHDRRARHRRRLGGATCADAARARDAGLPLPAAAVALSR
jgi:hypothetical protein